MPISGDTVLRLIRRGGSTPSLPPRVVGIDDWAELAWGTGGRSLLGKPAEGWRRGRSYGTIICDLERRRVIDLLPGRASAPVRDWLAAHPSVTVITRDRAGPYAEAARTGAPTAIQVADRWHLLVNASEALRSIVERHRPRSRTWHAGACRDRRSRPSIPPGRRRTAGDKTAVRWPCACMAKACRSRPSPVVLRPPATPYAVGCGPGSSFLTAGLRVQASLTVIFRLSKRAGRPVSITPEHFITN